MTLRSKQSATAPCVGFGQRSVDACSQRYPGDFGPNVIGHDRPWQPGCDRRNQAGFSFEVRTS